MINENGDQRYYAKRQAGITDRRRDGSKTTPENDRQSTAAEQYAADTLGLTFNDAIYSQHGDAGSDFVTRDGRTVDAKWLGMIPRRHGHLIVNPDDKPADIYVVVRGTIDDGFELVGWTTRETLTAQPPRDFGYGPKYAIPTERLNRRFRS